VEKIITGWKNW